MICFREDCSLTTSFRCEGCANPVCRIHSELCCETRWCRYCFDRHKDKPIMPIRDHSRSDVRSRTQGLTVGI